MRKELLVILLAVPLGANCAELDGIKILQPLSDAPIYTDYKGNTGSLYPFDAGNHNLGILTQ
ncbi:hypothetical protein ACPV5R_10325 [Vibrio astriarenae]